jgi:hypothetical protein
MRDRVYREAEEFVDRHWPMIERLGDEIFRRGKLDKREIEAVLDPPPATAKPSENSERFRAVPEEIQTVFHEAGHAVGALRQGLFVEGLHIDEDGGGRCRMLEPTPSPKGDRAALRRFTVATLCGPVAAERLTGAFDDEGAQHDLRDVERRVILSFLQGTRDQGGKRCQYRLWR